MAKGFWQLFKEDIKQKHPLTMLLILVGSIFLYLFYTIKEAFFFGVLRIRVMLYIGLHLLLRIPL